jgi:hypothetical protein
MPNIWPKGEDMVKEKARASAIFRTLTLRELQLIPLRRLARIYKLRLSLNQLWQIKNKFILAGGNMNNGETDKVQDIGAQVVLEQVAGVSSKTFANLGDAEKISSEDALRLINKLLKRYDASILDRNLKRRLPE